MPWQRLVADVGGELDPATGLPVYREVWLTVPRQSGKTTEVLAFEVHRALGFGGPQRIIYTAQTGNDARKKLVEDQFPILEPRKNKLGIRRCLRGMGNEGVEFVNGSRIVLMASGEDAGHGKTLDLAVIDEAFADEDFRREQAVVPAMNTRPAAQVLGLSTAGTAASALLRRKVDEGRAAVEAGDTRGIAYFEWSAPEDADPDDEAVWWSCMPALGHTIGIEAVRHARRSLSDGDFRRAYLNQWTSVDDRLIPASTWDLVCSPSVAPQGHLTFAVDLNDERSAAAVAVVDPERNAEVIEHRPLPATWLLDRVQELRDSNPSAVWTGDGSPSAPLASWAPDLERILGASWKPVKAADLPAASGSFFDAVADRKVSVRRHPSLDEAVAGASRRTVGDGWTWARRGSTDTSPLIAVTVGLWVATTKATSVYTERGLLSL